MFVANLSEILLPTSAHLFVLLLILCGAAYRPSKATGARPGRRRYVVLALLVWSYCLSTPRIASALIASLESRYPPVLNPSPGGDPLILVLSSGFTVKDGTGYAARLDSAGWERTWAATRLWKQVGGHLLFAGAPTPDHETSAAAYMAGVATAAGIPESAVLVETRSRNTYENLAFNRERAAAGGGNVWLVTSAIHMRRAMAVARKLGLTMRPYPCDQRAVPLLHWYSWLPNSGGPAMFADALHEWIGLLYYHLRGYAG